MKPVYFSAIFFALLISSSACNKSDGPTPDDEAGCVQQQVLPVSAHSISASEKAAADQLFARNGIDKRNFRYYRYSRSDVKTYYPPYATFDEQVVRVEEYTNGLRIFTGQSNFLFRNGVFTFRAGAPSGGTGLNTTPSLTPPRVGTLFRAAIKEFGTPTRPSTVQCIVAEFGYYNLNAGIGNAPERLVKAWKAALKGSECPFAYYEDQGGKLIYYDNGIRTFR